MGVVEDDDLVRRMRERLGRPLGELDLRPAEVEFQHDPDLIPDIEPYERSDDDIEIDGVLERLDIIDAYTRWIGKSQPNPGSKRESVMISCPLPNHADKNPSAWMNLDKETWFCGGCQVGGDKFDLAAIRFGYAYPDAYKRDGSFPQLRREMAEDLGYIVRRTPGGQEYVEKLDDGAEPVIGPSPLDPPSSQIELPDNNIISFPGIPADAETFHEQVEKSGAKIDWESIVTPDTFLWEWMESTTIDDLPHEYYFWLGMQALAFAAGTDVLMNDFRRIKPNLFVCLYGPTGTGKSRAIEPFSELLREAMPWDGDDYTASKGVQLLASPASAEALLRMFQHEIKDPSTQQVKERAQVKGLLRVEEFASFVARASRPTNPMKETLIELFDVLDHTMKHTSVTGGTVQAKDPFAQMVTSTQPKAIHAFLRRTDTESGFMNRWVFATGTRRRDRISYGGVQIDVSGSIQHLKMVKSWCGSGHTFVLDGAALAVWDEFFHSHIVPLHEEMDESMLSRIDLLLKKLIILFTVNDKEPQPTEATVRKAIAIYPYLRLTSMMFSKDIAHSDFEECRTRIAELVARSRTGVSMRELARGMGVRYERTLILQVIKTMVELGELAEEVNKANRGPATTRYKIVD